MSKNSHAPHALPACTVSTPLFLDAIQSDHEQLFLPHCPAVCMHGAGLLQDRPTMAVVLAVETAAPALCMQSSTQPATATLTRKSLLHPICSPPTTPDVLNSMQGAGGANIGKPEEQQAQRLPAVH